MCEEIGSRSIPDKAEIGERSVTYRSPPVSVSCDRSYDHTVFRIQSITNKRVLVAIEQSSFLVIV